MPKKFSQKHKAEVHEELEGFDISIDAFGQMSSTFGIDKLNSFLNKLNEDDARMQFSFEEE